MPALPGPTPRQDTAAIVLLAGLIALFLFRHLFLGRSLFSLDLITVFQPWFRHYNELWPSPTPVWDPLLDPVQFFFPRTHYMTRALHSGWLPFWWPYAYGGSPFLAGQQTPVFYPGTWLLALLPVTRQPGWSAFFHMTLAAAGAYVFFRELALRPAPALVGAAAFAFNGFLVVWLAYPNVSQSTFCWLPVILFLWERGRRGDDLRWIGACAAALALTMLGGHPQMAIYLWLAWFSWALFRTLGCSRPTLGLATRWILVPALIGASLCLGQLLPALDFVPRTHRAGRVPWETAVAGGMPLSQLWTFFLPRLFGDGTLASGYDFWLPPGGKAHLAFQERSCYPGIAALVVTSAGVVAALRRAWIPSEGESRQLARFALALGVAALLLGMGTPLYWPFWRFAPGFGHFNAIARILCLAAWAMACLAAVGAQELTHPDPARRAAAGRVSWITAAGCAAICLIGFYIYGGAIPASDIPRLARFHQPTADSQAARDLLLALLWVALPSLAVLLGRERSAGRKPIFPAGPAGWCLAGAVVADLFSFGFSLVPATDPAVVQVETPELRFLREQPDTFRFLSIGPAGREFDSRQRMPSDVPSVFGLLDIGGTDSFVPRRRVEWEGALARQAGASTWAVPGAPLLQAAGVRYYLTGSNETFPGLQPVVGPGVQEDPRALPLARLHTRAVRAANRAQLLTSLAARDRPVAVPLVEDAAGVVDGPAAVVPFTLRRENGNRLLVEGDAPRTGLVVVCEQYEPGWSAAIDGAPAKLTPADHLWIGVRVAAGHHRIRLTYAPQVCRVGIFAALAACAALAGLWVAAARPSIHSRSG